MRARFHVSRAFCMVKARAGKSSPPRFKPAPGRWSRSFYLCIYFITPAGGLGLIVEDVWPTVALPHHPTEGGRKASSRLLQESLLFVLKDNVFVFVCPHTYQLLCNLGRVVLRVPEKEVSMSAERSIAGSNTAPSPPGLVASWTPTAA